MAGNNVAHYSEALEWPVADRRVFCRIPVAPWTNTGAEEREGRFSLGSLLLLGYSRTVISWLVPRRLLFQRLVRVFSRWSPRAGHRREPKEILRGISTSCYVVLVRGESDELTLDSLRIRERQNRYFTASRNDPPPPPPNDATLKHTRETEENERHMAKFVFFLSTMIIDNWLQKSWKHIMIIYVCNRIKLFL